MSTALCRVNGNKVHAISEQNQVWQFDDEFFYMMFDPELPDGTQVREIIVEQVEVEVIDEDGVPQTRVITTTTFGPYDALGFAKIAEPGTNTIRNATQEEIDSWDALEALDDLAQDAKRARVQLVNHPLMARAFKALIRMIIANEERANARYNEHASQWAAFVNAMTSAATIAQIRTGMASVTPPPANLPENYDLQQILQNLLDDILPGDAPRRKERV